MISIQFQADRVIAYVGEELGPQLIASLERRMTSLAIRVQAHIVSNKLEGQVLHHRSGKLIGSIRVLPVQQIGGSLVGGVQGGGGPAWYGRIHEYGGTFHYTRHNARRNFSTNVIVHFPERSFMRSSLLDMRQTITSGLQQAIQEALGNSL